MPQIRHLDLASLQHQSLYQYLMQSVASRLNALRPHHLDTVQRKDSIRLVCISDTHCNQPTLPPGDVLLHAGDLTNQGTFDEIQEQLDWLDSQPHRYKIVIAGNHDLLLDPALDEWTFQLNAQTRGCSSSEALRRTLRWSDLRYLQDSATCLEFGNGRVLNVFGSPHIIECGRFAFQYPSFRDIWTNKIPMETDVLLTHNPPKLHLDRTPHNAGCPHLLKELWRVRPQIHVFGHIHAGRGQETLSYSRTDSVHDDIRLGQGGLLSLVTMVCSIILDVLVSLFATRVPFQQTKLVNAAIVGGPQNRERRAPIIVDI